MENSLYLILIMIGLGIWDQPNVISTSELQKLTGQWKGTLTYTDFSDDSSQSTLDCLMSASWQGKVGIIKAGFTEPNGSVVYDKSKIKILRGGDEVKFDGLKYGVESFEYIEPEGWVLVMITSGMDNNRAATIKQTIQYETTQLSLIKEVRYEQTTDFFVRNRYFFQREVSE